MCLFTIEAEAGLHFHPCGALPISLGLTKSIEICLEIPPIYKPHGCLRNPRTLGTNLEEAASQPESNLKITVVLQHHEVKIFFSVGLISVHLGI